MLRSNRGSRRLVLLLGLLIVSALLGGDTTRATHAPHASVRLLRGAASDSDAWVGLQLSIERGWHLYWSNPGDAGSPPTARWHLPRGWRADSIAFPAPHRISVADLTAFVYEDSVVLPVHLHGNAPLAPGTTLAADVSWVNCRVDCVEEHARAGLVVRGDVHAAQGDTRVAAAVRALPRALPRSLRIAATIRDHRIRLDVVGTDAPAWPVAEFFPLDPSTIDDSLPPRIITRGDTTHVELTLSRYAYTTPDRLRGVLVATGASRSSYSIDVPLTARPVAPSVDEPAPSGARAALLLLAGALLAGLLVNIMPCVLPVLGIKLLSITRDPPTRRGAGVQALAYTAGAALTSLALGGALFGVVRGVGTAAGWGFQMQSPRFVAVAALALCLIAMSCFDVLAVPAIGARLLGRSEPARHAAVTSATTGAATILLGAPCSGPLLGTTLAAAVAARPPIALGAFALFGIGAALPLAIAMVAPRVANRMPRAGRWSESIKQLLAFPMLATAAWLVWLVSVEAGSSGLAALLAALVVVALGAWIAGRWSSVAQPRSTRSAALGALVLSAGAALGFVGAIPSRTTTSAATPEATSATGAKTAWAAFSPRRLDSLRAAGHPVLVDFTAAWCLTCKVNERLVLRRDTVTALFARTGVVVLRADLTTRDLDAAGALAAVGRNSVPTYALYSTDASAPPRILPSLLTIDAVSAAVRRLAPGERVGLSHTQPRGSHSCGSCSPPHCC